MYISTSDSYNDEFAKEVQKISPHSEQTRDTLVWILSGVGGTDLLQGVLGDGLESLLDVGRVLGRRLEVTVGHQGARGVKNKRVNIEHQNKREMGEGVVERPTERQRRVNPPRGRWKAPREQGLTGCRSWLGTRSWHASARSHDPRDRSCCRVQQTGSFPDPAGSPASRTSWLDRRPKTCVYDLE